MPPGRRGRARPRLVLASSSPRRRQILALLGVPYAVRPVPVAEVPLPGESPEETARRLARLKAEAAAAGARAGVFVGADTIVVLDGAILGKPADAAAAVAMLRALRGRCHLVITGVAALNASDGRIEVGANTTRVCMRDYSDGEIAAYVASGEPFDKAGGYAIQSAAFQPVAAIDGCYLNVVGLPLCTLAATLCAVGFPFPPLPPERLADACAGCEQASLLATGCT